MISEKGLTHIENLSGSQILRSSLNILPFFRALSAQGNLGAETHGGHCEVKATQALAVLSGDPLVQSLLLLKKLSSEASSDCSRFPQQWYMIGNTRYSKETEGEHDRLSLKHES